MTAIPRVTAAAGCGGWGPELARFGALAELDALLVGPVGHALFPTGQPAHPPGAEGAGRPPGHPGHPGPQRWLGGRVVPGGLVTGPAPPRPPESVVSEVLPWLAARQLRALLAIRGHTGGEIADVIRTVRRSMDFSVVAGVEVDLVALLDQHESGDAGADRALEPPAEQIVLRAMSRAAEELPRACAVHAKVPVQHRDLIAIARSAVAGGATALVAAGPVSVRPGVDTLVGPCIAPVTLAGVERLRDAMVFGRLPSVPIIASGGIQDVSSARHAYANGAAGVQLGSTLLARPQLLWELTSALTGPASDVQRKPSPTETT